MILGRDPATALPSLLGGVLKQGCVFRGGFLVRLLIQGKYEESVLADCTDRMDGEQSAV